MKVVGTVAPFPGQPVCRSGRTLGWSCGTVDTVGIWTVGGPNNVPDGADLRALNGFDSTTVKSRPGDSGGPWISGNFAVGTHTGAEVAGGTQIRAIATTLEDALLRIPGGVQLKLFLNKPVPDAPTGGTVTAGAPVTGQVPAGPASVVAPNSRVRVTVEGQAPVEVPVDAAGNWSFPAPAATGPFNYTVETVNGFSRSGTAAREVLVSDLTAPVITSPAEGWQLAGADVIEGTGEPGRTVRLAGAVEGTALVADDGRWSISIADQPVYGKLSVTAVLSAAGHLDSPSASRAFTVLPPAPEVTSMPDGLLVSDDARPASISGTGLDGAEVVVSVDGVPVGTVIARLGSGVDAAGAGSAGGVGGSGAQGLAALSVPQAQPASGAPGSGAAGAGWSVPFPAGLTAGPHTLSVTQSIDGVASPPAVSSFILEAPAAGGAPVGAVPDEAPPAGAPVDAAPGPAARRSVRCDSVRCRAAGGVTGRVCCRGPGRPRGQGGSTARYRRCRPGTRGGHRRRHNPARCTPRRFRPTPVRHAPVERASGQPQVKQAGATTRRLRQGFRSSSRFVIRNVQSRWPASLVISTSCVARVPPRWMGVAVIVMVPSRADL